MPEFASGNHNIFPSCASNIWLFSSIFKDRNYNFVFNSITSISSESSKIPDLLWVSALSYFSLLTRTTCNGFHFIAMTANMKLIQNSVSVQSYPNVNLSIFQII